MDWRHPDSHAIYWAVKGARRGDQQKDANSRRRINTDRIVLHSLQNLFRYGRSRFFTAGGPAASEHRAQGPAVASRASSWGRT